MKVLVIALDAQIRGALEQQLEIRDHAFESVGLEWLQDCKASEQPHSRPIPRDIAVVVNALSLECLEQEGGLSAKEFDALVLAPLTLLAQSCERAAIPLIQLSSDQVFDGIDGGCNRDDDPLSPASRIGAQLSSVEALVRNSCQRHIILRTGPLFSSRENNLLTRLLNRFQQGEVLSLSSVGKCCPMHTSDLARVVTAVAEQLSCGAEPWGNYHYCSSDPVSHYQFAETVLAVVSQYSSASDQSLQLESLEVRSSGWPHPLLYCDKIFNTFGIKQLPWRKFISPTVKKFFS